MCLIKDQSWIDYTEITSRWGTFVLFHLYGNKEVSLLLWPIKPQWFHPFSPCVKLLRDGHELVSDDKTHHPRWAPHPGWWQNWTHWKSSHDWWLLVAWPRWVKRPKWLPKHKLHIYSRNSIEPTVVGLRDKKGLDDDEGPDHFQLNSELNTMVQPSILGNRNWSPFVTTWDL